MTLTLPTLSPAMERACPDCAERMEYQPPYRAEPDTNTRAWPGGWSCPGCGRIEPSGRTGDSRSDADRH